ncbi:hypothetical protein EDD17DRAFT_378937 [Pisolithus thermaeus]|nr:hypothetical protein EDD17DRAFT_378937 [Pisolithus thermaeus]
MKRRGGNHKSTILQHLNPQDMEAAVITLAVGGPVTLLVDDDVTGARGEVAGSDGLPTDMEANFQPQKHIGVDSAGESGSRLQLHRSSSGRGHPCQLARCKELGTQYLSSPLSSSISPIDPPCQHTCLVYYPQIRPPRPCRRSSRPSYPHPGGRGNAPSVSRWSCTRLVACLLHHLRTTVNQKRKTAGRGSTDCPRQVGVRGLYGDVKIEADRVITPV